MKLVLKDITPSEKEVHTDTGVHIGNFVMDVDGFWYYLYNRENHGIMSSYSLDLISAKLKEINAPWDAQLEEYFKSLPPQDEIPEL